jgi:hypothetical protein
LGVGVTASAILLSGALASGNGNACRGSGEYLQFCRTVFVGGIALAGGVGALVGSLMKRDSPAGRAQSVFLGSAIGAVVPFLVSIPACEQEEQDNPERLCGWSGTVKPDVTIVAAVLGGLAGYLLGGRTGGLEVTYIGPRTAGEGSTALGLVLSRSLP